MKTSILLALFWTGLGAAALPHDGAIRPGRYVGSKGEVVTVTPTRAPGILRFDAEVPRAHRGPVDPPWATPLEREQVSFFYAEESGIPFYIQSQFDGLVERDGGRHERNMVGLEHLLSTLRPLLANDQATALLDDDPRREPRDTQRTRLAAAMASFKDAYGPETPATLAAREWVHEHSFELRDDRLILRFHHDAHARPRKYGARTFRYDHVEDLSLGIDLDTRALVSFYFGERRIGRGERQINCASLLEADATDDADQAPVAEAR